MKARIEDGTIVIYSELPKSFKNDEVNIIGEFDRLSKEELEGYGFYDIIEPKISENQTYGKPYWDDLISGYIYAIIDKPYKLPNPISKSQFLSKFSQAEKIAIFSKENENITIKIWLEIFRASNEIQLTDQSISDGVYYLESAGILAIGRAAEILI